MIYYYNYRYTWLHDLSAGARGCLRIAIASFEVHLGRTTAATRPGQMSQSLVSCERGGTLRCGTAGHVLVVQSCETLLEGSLEVKLPTIWTDGEAEVGRVREEKKRSEKIREEKE